MRGETVARRAACVLAASGVATAVGLASTGANAVSLASVKHRPRGAIDDLAPYQPQRTCDPRAKPGVVAFRARVLRAYPATADNGIGRACATGGASEHKEGRAWDWGVNDKKATKRFLKSLLARDRGVKYADARRFGIMYIIYNKRIWRSYGPQRGWERLDCSGATECHENHVHFSFSWEGAEKRTSAWDGTPVRYRRH